MKILICGDRNYTDKERIRKVIISYSYGANLIVIEGGAKGADTLAREICEELAIPFKEYKSEWAKYGKAAGPIRNKLMLDDNPEIELVIAFHNNIEESKGTKNMVEQAKERGINVIIQGENNG